MKEKTDGEGGREREKKKRHGTALVSLLKQILVILAVVIYKILKKTFVL
jgi:hypothetical protein